MRCSKCGCENSEKAKFCHNCGNQIANLHSIEEQIEGQPESALSVISLVLYILSIVSIIISPIIAFVMFAASFVTAHISYESGKRTTCADIAWWLHVSTLIIAVLLFVISIVI